MSSRMNIQKAKADAQAKRDKFLIAAKTYHQTAETTRNWIRWRAEDRKVMEDAHREFLAVEKYLK